jgi:hypothetical protein
VNWEEAADNHKLTLTGMCENDGCLQADSPHATINNRRWFRQLSRTPRGSRRRLHDQILAEFTAACPLVEQDRKAIILAGPPGAGKSTAQDEVVAETMTQKSAWLPLNADDFKDQLLMRARDDGTYVSFLCPDMVKKHERKGEKFFPRELAVLVHEESSLLVKQATAEAIYRGDNIIVDGTLASVDKAHMLLRRLSEAGYSVMIADVETPHTVSQIRVIDRWRKVYVKALAGTADGQDKYLGGRWVPAAVLAELYSADTNESISAANALSVSEKHFAVISYKKYVVEDEHSGPECVTWRRRSSPQDRLGDCDLEEPGGTVG